MKPQTKMVAIMRFQRNGRRRATMVLPNRALYAHRPNRRGRNRNKNDICMNETLTALAWPNVLLVCRRWWKARRPQSCWNCPTKVKGSHRYALNISVDVVYGFIFSFKWSYTYICSLCVCARVMVSMAGNGEIWENFVYFWIVRWLQPHTPTTKWIESLIRPMRFLRVSHFCACPPSVVGHFIFQWLNLRSALPPTQFGRLNSLALFVCMFTA